MTDNELSENERTNYIKLKDAFFTDTFSQVNVYNSLSNKSGTLAYVVMSKYKELYHVLELAGMISAYDDWCRFYYGDDVICHITEN